MLTHTFGLAQPAFAGAMRRSTIKKGLPMQRRRGFTLVEMLLVVAVIALLISILLPSLSRSKENARRSVCASNLHQISAALDQYVIEYLRRFPGGNATLTPGNGIDSSYSVPNNQPMGLAFLITKNYIGPQLFYCPSWTHPWNQYDKVDVAGDDYWFDSNMMGGWPAPGKPGPTAHRGFSYHYRSTFGVSYNRPPNPTLPGNTSITADHWVQREVLYGTTFGHKDGYNNMTIDGRVTWKPDPIGGYMVTMQPPAMGITNGNWAYQEIIWTAFFDK